ncbi:AAA family ATPase [Solirubrobacter taibaiensis]|nr:AAA family ATPase [Solirubrobacter taibaiensis]
MVFLGRHSEREALDRLLDAVRAGESRALVLRGEAGIGKSALLAYAAERAIGCEVARTAGVHSETGLAFAALQQLCAPLLGHLDALPDPQRDALGIAFGLRAGPPPDRFLVGLALLGLLAEAGRAQPLIGLVDDAQWLDRASAQALAFVARRLRAESVGLIVAVRASGNGWSGLPERVVRGLGVSDARALLVAAIHGPLDAPVRDRIIAEAHGNPLALLELPHALAGGFGLPDDVPAQLVETFQHRLAALPDDTRTLLLVAAIEAAGASAVIWSAAAQLGVGADAADPAEAAGLCEFAAAVRFRHPLVRSAVYRAAEVEERRAVHRALADAVADPERRAWHRGHGAAGADEDIAAELERSAGLAQARGGIAAAAAFLERAAELTPAPENRARRVLAAAQAKYHAGAPDEAARLLAAAGPLDELAQAQVDVLRAQIAFAESRGRDAPALLLRAARRLEPLDLAAARDTYLDALAAATVAGRLSGECPPAVVARAALAAPASPEPPRAPDLLLDGMALLASEGYPAAAPTLRRALAAFRDPALPVKDALRWMWFAAHAALDLWDDASWELLATRHVALARQAGALTVLPAALNTRAGVHLGLGELDQAALLLDEVRAMSEATGSPGAAFIELALAALRGDTGDVERLATSVIRDATARGEGIAVNVAHWSRAVLGNGLGRFEDALAAAQQATHNPDEVWTSAYGAVELIEAAARTGAVETAAAHLERLAVATQASGTPFALGMELRCRALLSEGEVADRRYREAIEALARTRVRVELARAHLLYGEWLRRERRRLDAREQLRAARELFADMGAEAFAARAGHELRATGETARRRQPDTGAGLTAQEDRIARLARDGLSNPEIAERLFVSPRTVEYHLHKVFAKLGIRSRGQLERALER